VTERLRRFYSVAVWLPVIVPLCCLATFAAMGGGMFEGFGASVGIILVVSLFSTGVPYAIFALWVSHWLRAAERTEKEVRRVMWGAPLIVAVFALPYWTVTLWIRESMTDALFGILFYVPYLLVIGYLYVVIVAVGRWALGRTQTLGELIC
jgi:hypothetical protein